jgi:hypothetical protein
MGKCNKIQSCNHFFFLKTLKLSIKTTKIAQIRFLFVSHKKPGKLNIFCFVSNLLGFNDQKDSTVVVFTNKSIAISKQLQLLTGSMEREGAKAGY